jgi:hypothetical protein
MDLIKNRKKCHFLTIVLSEKFKYLENGTIFCQALCVEIHQTLASIKYIKTSPIGDHRLDTGGRGLRKMAHRHFSR